MEGFLTVGQVAERAGVHTGTVYRWLYDPDVPLDRHKTPAGRVLISEEQAVEWIRLRLTPVVVDTPQDPPAGAGS